MTKQEMLEKKRRANELGLAAEQAAVDYLVSLGYAIKERRWKPFTGKGEIDIIAMAGTTMVFAEVKCRTLTPESDPDSALRAVDAAKRRNMAIGADKYLAAQPLLFNYRFDILTVDMDSCPPKITHIPDAFVSPLFAGH